MGEGVNFKNFNIECQSLSLNIRVIDSYSQQKNMQVFLVVLPSPCDLPKLDGFRQHFQAAVHFLQQHNGNQTRWAGSESNFASDCATLPPPPPKMHASFKVLVVGSYLIEMQPL